MLDWRKVRRLHDNKIDLCKAFEMYMDEQPEMLTGNHQREAAQNYLRGIEDVMTIRSRQAAAVAIITAIHLARIYAP